MTNKINDTLQAHISSFITIKNKTKGFLFCLIFCGNIYERNNYIFLQGNKMKMLKFAKTRVDKINLTTIYTDNAGSEYQN